MLVLDRKVQEGFWIDGGIFVKVLGVGKQRVKLGIEAPDDIKIVREELLSRASDETAAARGPIISKNDTPVEGSFRPVRRRN